MRFQVFENPEPKFPYHFQSSSDVYDVVKDYSKADREVFLVLLLTSKNQMIDCITLFVGSLDSAGVWPREIIKAAVASNTASVILAHNHPSNDTTPSTADKEITKSIIAACQFFGIQVLDHLIVCRTSYFSFADQGLIDEYRRVVKDLFQTMRITP